MKITETGRAQWLLRVTACIIAVTLPGIAVQSRVRAADDEIVFSSSRNCNWDLWTVQVDTGTLHQLTATSRQEKSPVWSPDKKRIVFADNSGGLYIMDRDGSNARPISTGQNVTGQPKWRPDGHAILFVSFFSQTGDTSKVYSINIDEPAGRGPELLVDRQALVQHPDWSPDGRHILYSMFRRGAFGEPREELWLRDLDAETDTEVTRTGVQNVNASISPDGKNLVFESTLRDNADIWLLALDEYRLTRLTEHPGYDGEPCWSPDGKRIAFVSTKDGSRAIWIMNKDGSNKKLVVKGGGDYRAPDW
ncbi:MAG: PD40 domain-containing protein [Candidatus Hydrogenedentes bacterium]|nr:PD40 domain-containing protein [Candidatus Hydrogenedentota bacterium]